jgi:hypothetical protein
VHHSDPSSGFKPRYRILRDQAFNDSSQIEGTVDFPYEEIDGLERDEDGPKTLARTDHEEAFKLFSRLVEWLWQNGMKNPEGLQLRAIVVCWVFLNHLHPLTLTEMARGFGKHKQSAGRWVDNFKAAFPHIQNPHMRPPK